MASDKGMRMRSRNGLASAPVVSQVGITGSSAADLGDGFAEASSSASLQDGSGGEFLAPPKHLHGRATGPQRKSTKGHWTPEEDELLRQAVHHYKGKNWKKIAESFQDRTDVQCLHRWQKVLNPSLVKGPWTKEEDDIIIQMVQQYGQKKWSTIAQALPGRIGKQCRERWHNHLNPAINKEAWTQEEEIVLIHGHQKYGNKWAELTKYLPGRTDNAIKNHWNSSVKKKVDSYMASGMLAKYPSLAQCMPTKSINPKDHYNGLKDRLEIEDSSECSSSAPLPSCQSESEMATNPLSLVEDFKKVEASFTKDTMKSDLFVCSEQNYCSFEESHPQIASSGSLSHAAEEYGNVVSQDSLTQSDDDFVKKAVLLPISTPQKSSTSGQCLVLEEKNKLLVSNAEEFSANLSDMQLKSNFSILHPVNASHTGDLEVVASYVSCIPLVHTSSACSNLASCSCPVFQSPNTSEMPETPYCSSLMSVVPSSFVCPSDNVEIQVLSSSLQHLRPIAGAFCSVLEPCSSLAPVPEAQVGQIQGENEVLTEHTGCRSLNEILYPEDEEKGESEKVIEIGGLSLSDEKADVDSEQFLETGTLFYEPPRIISLEFPFVSCDIAPSYLQQEYSPLGIRQHMISSGPCNFWDSPCHDDSPDGILKNAAKSFILTPSIMKKRQRELLSPMQNMRSDKKLGVDMNQESLFRSLIKGEACMDDDVICDSAAERIRSINDAHDTSFDLRERSGKCNMQNENLNHTLIGNDGTCAVYNQQEKIEKGKSGAHVPSEIDSVRKEIQCGRVLVEIKPNVDTCTVFPSPGSCGTKHVQHSTPVTSLRYPPSSKKPQLALEKCSSMADSERGNLNIFANTPNLRRGLDSPSAWKSPWFMHSFAPGANLAFEDFKCFMSPIDRSYDALSLMKQVSEQSAVVIAEAQEILGKGCQHLDFDTMQSIEDSLPEGIDEPGKEQENLIPMPSNVLAEGRVLDFSDCVTPADETKSGRVGDSLNASLLSNPCSRLLKTCR
ncbi:Myb-related protein 3R-1 [Apostasia shenzhenica]|uniref:Myb-related protein 3R-1 n=1 Tax=Apostasia shenzhenica TaxID=1088818 RepID=A0A2I0AFY3_9ASPA|nr:Myb-related protein 3R-1 [Apostasia shenzhenica]